MADYFLGRLHLAGCVAMRAAGVPSGSRVRVLDPVTPGWRTAMVRAAAGLMGLGIEEAEFFAGHITTPDGLPAQVAGTRQGVDAALPEAEALFESSPTLAALAREWDGATLRLHAAKSFVMSSNGRVYSTHAYALQVHSARALAAQDSKLFLETPAAFRPDALIAMAPDLSLHFYGRASAWWASRAHVMRRVGAMAYKALKGRWQGVVAGARASQLQARAATRAGILLSQEDDIGMDRSYRFQPHWLLPEDGRPGFDTYLLPQAGLQTHDPQELERSGVRPLTAEDVAALSAPLADDAAGRKLRKAAWSCVFAALGSASPAESVALANIARLFMTAAGLSALTRRLSIRAFMTAENYLVEADAMQLVAAGQDLHTLSYQYSNLASKSTPMLTTAKTMLTFAPGYDEFWRHRGIAPKRFQSIGYCFDHAFARVAPRSAALRRTLQDAGARFVLCYFDESVQQHKYGLISERDHEAELLALLEELEADASLGVIVKVQFQRNAPSRLPAIASAVEKARATGRYLELSRGSHRNNILPAEAALAADLSIGHAIGGTAPFEAALAGRRAILLNPYGIADGNQRHYSRVDVMFGALSEALPAIASFRGGTRPELGDWSRILPSLDPYRDGKAAHRLRHVLDTIAGADAGTSSSALHARLA